MGRDLCRWHVSHIGMCSELLSPAADMRHLGKRGAWLLDGWVESTKSRSRLDSRPCHLELWSWTFFFFFGHFYVTSEKEAKKVEGFDPVQKPSYYIRLGSLSTKLRSWAYQQALSRVKEAKQKSQETISQLHATVNLVSTTSFKGIWSEFIYLEDWE